MSLAGAGYEPVAAEGPPLPSQSLEEPALVAFVTHSPRVSPAHQSLSQPLSVSLLQPLLLRLLIVFLLPLILLVSTQITVTTDPEWLTKLHSINWKLASRNFRKLATANLS